MRVLLLAGTAEASALATALATEPGVEVVASFAGHTTPAAGWPCAVRVGGFGGAAGLAEVLRREGFDALVDATHPFSATMPTNAMVAAADAGVPHLRLARPPWLPSPDDRWDVVADMDAAAARLADLSPSCVLLTVGRLELAPFRHLAGTRLVVRSIEVPDAAMLPEHAVVVTGRGPFRVEDEVVLLRHHGVDVVVTKNSGGDDAKLQAARQVGATVVMVDRPAGEVPTGATTTEDARRWVLARVAASG